MMLSSSSLHGTVGAGSTRFGSMIIDARTHARTHVRTYVRTRGRQEPQCATSEACGWRDDYSGRPWRARVATDSFRNAQHALAIVGQRLGRKPATSNRMTAGTAKVSATQRTSMGRTASPSIRRTWPWRLTDRSNHRFTEFIDRFIE